MYNVERGCCKHIRKLSYIIHLFIDGQLGCFQLLAIIIVLPWIRMYKYLSEIIFSIPLSLFPEMRYLDPMTVLFLIFYE